MQKDDEMKYTIHIESQNKKFLGDLILHAT